MNNTLNITVDGEALTVPEGIPPPARRLTATPARRFAAWGSARSAGSPSTAGGCWPARPCAGPACK